LNVGGKSKKIGNARKIKQRWECWWKIKQGGNVGENQTNVGMLEKIKTKTGMLGKIKEGWECLGKL
jgi:hypothetical protein